MEEAVRRTRRDAQDRGGKDGGGLTQQELAERCGMKASNLCRLENSNGSPSAATLEKIARGLDRRLEIGFV